MDEYVNDVKEMSKYLHDEYGLPESVENLLLKMDKNWFKCVEYEYLPKRLCEYIVTFGKVTDLVSIEMCNSIANKIIGKDLPVVPEIISMFCGVNDKKFIRELTHEELRDFDACITFFYCCDKDTLVKYVDNNASNVGLCGLNQINSVLGLNLEAEEINSRILEVKGSRLLNYYSSLLDKNELSVKEEYSLNSARRMGYSI